MRVLQTALVVAALTVVCWALAAEATEWLGLVRERSRAACTGGLLGFGLGGGLVLVE